MLTVSGEFSYRSRTEALERFRTETFDLLIIGGGITGAAVARDAASRGLKVALVEAADFAHGTSSRSSKLIHGGLRYLQNLELGLVFEALAERALLLKTAPHMVRPLPFYLPIYAGDPNGRALLTMGMWLYDLLALFRTPGFHRGLSAKKLAREIPFLRTEGLKGGFRYYDASMWDDVLAVETLRAAHGAGAAIANYVEAVAPIWSGDRVAGFRVRDRDHARQSPENFGGVHPRTPGRADDIELKSHCVVVCAGPWTDRVGLGMTPSWRKWLNPSKGVHLLFDLKRLPVPGALVMSHPEDGRISFVIPRPDLGAGVTIVGTTDGPTPADPEAAVIEPADVNYLMDLLHRYFPTLELKTSDILSGYVGVRPLLGDGVPNRVGAEGQRPETHGAEALQKVSREHHIDRGPGGTVIVAGGKYTTHRKMGEEIVDFTLKTWREETLRRGSNALPKGIRRSATRSPVNPRATFEATASAREDALRRGIEVPAELWGRYGAEALEILDLHQRESVRHLEHAPGRAEPNRPAEELGGGTVDGTRDPQGFPWLASQLRFSMRKEMVLKLEDFYLRRVPLYASRADHGLPWLEELAEVWAEERGLDPAFAAAEAELVRRELARRSAWQAGL